MMMVPAAAGGRVVDHLALQIGGESLVAFVLLDRSRALHHRGEQRAGIAGV